MNDEILVEVEEVSKKFCRSLKRSLWYGVQDVTSELIGHRVKKVQLRKNEFWAIQNVNFSLRRGECLGLIGPNGAGKSTVLKMLNGLVKPDKGHIRMRGRIGALIELGAGFNPILTARENIYINGSILGFSKHEITKKFDDIIDFAEIDEFVDTPVKNFSSGMKVRLGFAVAAQMEPDVLLIDEVLAVGDIGFRMKCFNAIRKMSSNSAIILVSHQMPEIARSATRAICMARGEALSQSTNVAEVIECYFENTGKNRPTSLDGPYAKIESVKTFNEFGSEIKSLEYLSDLMIEISFFVDESIESPNFGVSFLNANLQLVLQCHSTFDRFKAINRGGRSTVKLTLARLPLSPGTYTLSVSVDGPGLNQILARRLDACELQITGDFVGFAPVVLRGNWEFSSSPKKKLRKTTIEDNTSFSND